MASKPRSPSKRLTNPVTVEELEKIHQNGQSKNSIPEREEQILEPRQERKTPGEDLFTPLHTGGTGNARHQDMAAAIQGIFDPLNLELKSILTPNQIAHIARGSIYAEKYRSERLTALIAKLLKLQVSGKRNKEGSGRADMVTAIQAALVTAEVEEKKSEGLRRRLLGF